MSSITNRTTSNISLKVDLDDDEVFDHTERWGSKRTLRIRALRVTGDPSTGKIDPSVSLYGLNVKKDGTEGQIRATHASVKFADLTGSVQAQVEEAFATACEVFANEVLQGALTARQHADAVVA